MRQAVCHGGPPVIGLDGPDVLRLSFDVVRDQCYTTLGRAARVRTFFHLVFLGAIEPTAGALDLAERELGLTQGEVDRLSALYGLGCTYTPPQDGTVLEALTGDG